MNDRIMLKRRLAMLSLVFTLAVVALAGCGATPASPTAPSAVPVEGTMIAPTAEVSVATTEQPSSTPAAQMPSGGRPAGVMPGGPGSSMPATTATPIVKDAAYANISTAQQLDLYVPEGEGPFPVIVTIHGGGFMLGDKADAMATTGIDQLLEAGYAVASINYRLSSEALAPAQIQDAKAAVRWLRANAVTYQLDPERVGAWGASAGGNLAALLGTSCDAAALEGAELGNADQSSCVQAVVDWFGPTDFLQMDTQFAGTSCPQTHDEANSPESQLLGAPIQSVPEQAQLVNPLTYIDANDAPFLIQHGTADCNVPPQQSVLLYDALVAAQGDENVTFISIEGAGHGGEQFFDAANFQVVLDFFAKHLGRS
ncbi:alpha/beta hydrolase [Candidatus Chloroploca asiatica]|nr:alpha/beta hydrolase [Candidatus Chloroploca asiatica]